MPKFEEMIFSPKREAALELLDHNKKGICIDYGAMWGVLSVGMAKRGHEVIAVDKTHDSLKFLKSRSQEEGLDNIHLVHDDIREIKFENIADYAIVNGVLEWIPEKSEIIVDEYLSNSNFKSKNSTGENKLKKPREMQLEFLKKVHKSLNKEGQLLLAIENKLFYGYLMGKPDPHVNLKFTTFLPRFISNIISRIFKKKDYRTHIYTFNELKNLLKEAGFLKIDDYYVKDLSFNEAAAKIRGIKGTKVILTVKRFGEDNSIDFTLVRSDIKVKDITYAGLITSSTGYIRLNANPNNTATPYIDIVERTGSKIYDIALKARLGDLSGLANSDLVFGNSDPVALDGKFK